MSNASSEQAHPVEGQPVPAAEALPRTLPAMKPSESFRALALEEGGQCVSAGLLWRERVYVPGPNTPKREGRLLDRFLRYVRVGTTADEKSATYPSTPGQRVLGRMLLDELLEMGVRDAVQDDNGIVYGTVPRTAEHRRPDGRLRRPRRYVAGDDRGGRAAHRPRAV